jgi:O-methyltransferase
MTEPVDRQRALYLDLLRRTLTNYAYLGGDVPFDRFRCINHYDVEAARWKIDALSRPATLLTRAQLDLIEAAAVMIEREGVAGDFLEAGIWRGGAVIFLRGLIEAYAMPGRRVVAADSFAGIPVTSRTEGDPVDGWNDRWVASLDEVRGNIDRFGLLDDRIVFLVGFFEDSLPTLTDEGFALIRLDSDSYDSVETSLDHLYPRVSPGGVVIVDDWHLPGCRKAVLDYRARHGIREELQLHDGNAYWVKQPVRPIGKLL